MTKNFMHMAQILRCKSKKGMTGIRKVSSAHITTCVVAAALFVTVYGPDNLASEPSRDLFEVWR